MTILQIITYIGVFVFALTGAFKARAAKMDVLGGLILAFVTAYGGGTLRDLLLGIRPINWLNDNIALLLVLLGTAITFLIKDHYNKFRRTIFFTDAIGLGLFTAAGIDVAIRQGANEVYAVVMGVMTATFGGVIGDIISNNIPTIFKRGELYATTCVAGGIVYILMRSLHIDNDWKLVACVFTVISLRIYSKRKRLSLPEI